MDEHIIEIKSRKWSLEKISFLILSVFLVILPFFFIPSRFFPYQLGKGLLISVAILVIFIVYLISIIKEGKITIPNNLFFLSVIIIPIVFLLSTLINGNFSRGFLGLPFEAGTTVFLLLGALLLFLTSQLFKSNEKIFYAYLAFFASFAIVALFQLIRIFAGASALSFGIFTNSASNLIGNWNDLAVFFGASTLLSIITLEMLPIDKRVRVISYFVFFLSLIFLCVVNFSTIWVILAIFAAIILIYLFLFDSKKNTSSTDFQEKKPKRKISYTSILLLALSLLFIFFGTTLGDKISKTAKITNLEVRPSWTSTFQVVKNSLKDNTLVGSGPNTFSFDWLKYKPDGINETIFWNTDFNSGIGHITTFFATTGLLGILSWVFFIGFFIYLGSKALFDSSADIFSKYLRGSSFLVALFIWVVLFVYTPTITIFILAFFFTGLFAAILFKDGLLQKKELLLSNFPKLSFVAVLAVIALLIGSVSLLYGTIRKSASLVNFQKSILGYQENGNIEKAEARIDKAIKLWDSDIYYRGLSEIGIIKMSSILNRQNADPESIRNEFQKVLVQSINGAIKSTKLDPNEYQNWLSLARVYSVLVPPPLSIPGSYENAKKNYEEALARNPHNPSIFIFLARLDASVGNLSGSRDYVNKAISEKPNYAEAHFLLAQIEVSEGNLAKATASLETTLLLTPSNPGLFFQLGILKYNERDWDGAINAFENAIILVPDYANAKYFLGLSYWQVGKKEEAKKQFEDIEKTNPDNQEIKLILSNIQAGKDPFSNAKPPITSRPENREKLPLEQKN